MEENKIKGQQMIKWLIEMKESATVYVSDWSAKTVAFTVNVDEACKFQSNIEATKAMGMMPPEIQMYLVANGHEWVADIDRMVEDGPYAAPEKKRRIMLEAVVDWQDPNVDPAAAIE